jgi:hypothetical protein
LIQPTLVQFLVKLSGASGGLACNGTIALLDYLIAVANHADKDDIENRLSRERYVNHTTQLQQEFGKRSAGFKNKAQHTASTNRLRKEDELG